MKFSLDFSRLLRCLQYPLARMAMYKVVLSVWILSFALMHCNCQTTTMTPAVADVIEGSNVTLVCKVSAVLQHVFTTWMLNTSIITPVMIYENGTCVGLNLGDKDKYSISCNNTVFMLTVHNVDRSQHNSMWTCIAADQSNRPKSVIKVKVPIASVTITPSTSTVIEENNSKPLKCNTSEGRPAGSVRWYKLEYGVKSQINQNTTEIQKTNADGFIETTSYLRYVPAREQNGIKIYCEAGNTANSNNVKSSETLLYVLYPPKVGNLSVMDILEGTSLNMMCPFTPGNPPKTTAKWTRNIDARTWNQEVLTIQSVTRNDDANYICELYNVVSTEVKETGTFHLNVQYEPDAPIDLRHVERLKTESSIQLEWKPGYDGGPPQTFYIKYKKSSSSTWNFVSVPDNGEQAMQYMLNGLVSDTQYHLIIYSSNRRGNSTVSEILIAKTKGKMKSNPASMIGGVVGGLVVFTVIVVVIVFIVRRYKIRKGLQSSDAKKETTREVQVASQSNNEATYYNEEGIPDYEMLNQQNRDVTTYSSLQPNNSSLSNDNSSDEQKTYVNLQLAVI